MYASHRPLTPNIQKAHLLIPLERSNKWTLNLFTLNP